MLKSSPFTHSAAIAATVVALSASPAVARQADQPVRSRAAVTTVVPARQWTQARVDASGVRPVDRVAAPAAPAVPLTQGQSADSGRTWLLIPILGMLAAFLLILAVARAEWHWVHPFRARHL